MNVESFPGMPDRNQPYTGSSQTWNLDILAQPVRHSWQVDNV